MPLFDRLSKAYLDAQEENNEKLNKRKSKRFNRLSEAIHRDELDDLADPNFSKQLLSSITGRTSTGSDFEEDDEDLLEDRPKWGNNYIMLIFTIGYVTGLTNVWRFGYLCKVHGGIAFLIPYCLLNLVCAFPCLYLELLIGQYAQVGAIAAWKICPLFKGVGLCMTLLTFMASFNVQSVLAWCLFYMFQSACHSPLPWIACDNGFGKLKSGQRDENMERWYPVNSHEEEAKNWHTVNCTDFFADAGTGGILKPNQRLPGAEFFRGRVQRMWKSWYSDGLENNFTADNGAITFGYDSNANAGRGILEYNIDTVMTLIGVFILVEVIVAKGIKINSKILLVLVGFPYVILILLFYRATGLRGAGEGLGELFRPNYTQLFSPDTWWKCAEQVFHSTGVGFGVHLTSASHNHFNRRIVYDAVFIVVVNSLTSLISACTIFMFLGHVKVALDQDLSTFVRSGPQLAFEVMSDVLGVLAKANFYAFCFYSSLFFLALTTVAAQLICAKISYLEVLPVSLKYKSGARILMVTVLVASSFVISSLNLTRGGLHTYNYIGTYVGLYSLVLSAWIFLIGISWVFGKIDHCVENVHTSSFFFHVLNVHILIIQFKCLREIVEATKAMGIRCPGIYYQICWKYINPIVIGAILFGITFDPDSHKVMFDGREVKLGMGLTIVGYAIGIGPFLTVIGGAFQALVTAPGKNFKEKFLISISPSNEHKKILATGTGKRAKMSHYFYLYEPTEGAKYNLCCSFHGHSKVAPEGTEPADNIKADVTNTEDKPKDNLKIPEIEEPKKTPSSEIKAEKLNKTPSSEIKAENLNKTPSSEIKAEKPVNSEPSPGQNQKRNSKNSAGSQEGSKKKKPQCLVQ